MIAEPVIRPAALGLSSGSTGADLLLESAWKRRDRSIRGSELRRELWVNAVFLVVAGSLALTSTVGPAIQPIAAGLVLAYAFAARVEFPIGAGHFVPTQLFLVPLFAVAPAEYVPLLVFAAFAIAALAAAATGAAKLDRVVFSAGDAAHSLGPALFLTLFASGDATTASPLLIAGAFVAQVVADFASSAVHVLLELGAKASAHVRNLLRIWAVDLALGAVGLLAGAQAVSTPWAALAPLPLVVLLRQLAADRTRRIDAAHERLVALELERGRREAAAVLVERQTEFLQDASHELRTPVTIARGHIENLVREAGALPAASVALDELARIERIVERLLMMARADQPATLHRMPLQAEELLEDCFVRWSDAIPRPWQLAEVAVGELTVDRDALLAAVDALIENAVKHTTAAQRIRLSSTAFGSELTISVADGGSGIPPEALGHIFDRFVRAEPANRVLDGVGLGLAMVHTVAKAHGGTCAVRSSPEGSVFELRLPGFRPAPP